MLKKLMLAALLGLTLSATYAQAGLRHLCTSNPLPLQCMCSLLQSRLHGNLGESSDGPGRLRTKRIGSFHGCRRVFAYFLQGGSDE